MERIKNAQEFKKILMNNEEDREILERRVTLLLSDVLMFEEDTDNENYDYDRRPKVILYTILDDITILCDYDRFSKLWNAYREQNENTFKVNFSNQ